MTYTNSNTAAIKKFSFSQKKSIYRVNKVSNLNLSLVSVILTFKGEVTLLSMQNFIRDIKPWWYMVHITI